MSTTTGYEYKPKSNAGRIANFVDTRVGMSGVVKEFGRKIFPDHWSFMFGEVALYSFVVLLISGTFLTFWFNPSTAAVTYDGSYVPMKGPVDPSDSPLGGSHVYVGHLYPHAPCLLYRGFPPST